jgi:hypothetical protein
MQNAGNRFQAWQFCGKGGVRRLRRDRLGQKTMDEGFHPRAADFRRDVELLCRELEPIAFRSGASEADCDDPQLMFAALPLTAREEIVDHLDRYLHPANDDERGIALAAGYLLKLAREVWEEVPMPVAMPTSHDPPALD